MYGNFFVVLQRMWVFGVPLPRWAILTADGESISTADRHGWEFTVTVKAPILGELMTYYGTAYPEEEGE